MDDSASRLLDAGVEGVSTWASPVLLVVGVARLGGILLALALGVSAATAADLDAFGRCLARRGATFYGASWCPQCARQERVLADAMDHVDYVECSAEGTRRQTPECEDADIHGYPTWAFKDGSRVRGVQSLDQLARRTGCKVSEADAATSSRSESSTSSRSSHGIPTRERRVPGSGARIIEIR